MTYPPLVLAAAYIQAGELDEALVVLTDRLTHAPHDEDARRLCAQVRRHIGTTQQRQAALDDLAQLTTHTAEDILLQVQLLLEEDALPAALEVLARGCAALPLDERLTERYLTLLLQAQQYTRALDVVRQQPDHWRWHGWQADTLAQMGDDEGAVPLYTAVIHALEKRYPDEPYMMPVRVRFLLACAQSCQRLGRLLAADGHYRAAQTLMPQDASILWLRGLVTFALGDMRQAIEQCRQAWAAASPNERARWWAALEADPTYTSLRPALEITL